MGERGGTTGEFSRLIAGRSHSQLRSRRDAAPTSRRRHDIAKSRLHALIDANRILDDDDDDDDDNLGDVADVDDNEKQQRESLTSSGGSRITKSGAYPSHGGLGRKLAPCLEKMAFRLTTSGGSRVIKSGGQFGGLAPSSYRGSGAEAMEEVWGEASGNRRAGTESERVLNI